MDHLMQSMMLFGAWVAVIGGIVTFLFWVFIHQ